MFSTQLITDESLLTLFFNKRRVRRRGQVRYPLGSAVLYNENGSGHFADL